MKKQWSLIVAIGAISAFLFYPEKRIAHSRLFPEAKVTKLQGTLEIKQRWLYSEWDPHAAFSKGIQRDFPKREALNPAEKDPDIEKITSLFHRIRGQWELWQEPRETAKWTKIEVDLPLKWVKKHVEVLYPQKDRFPVSELDGIVLWDSGKGKYKLYEGNHRISAWISAGSPEKVRAVVFIGKPNTTQVGS